MARLQNMTYWKKLLTRHDESGLSLKKFCEQQDLNYKTALKYRHLVDAEKQAAKLNFIELPSTAPAAASSHSLNKFELDNGISLTLLHGFCRQKFLKIIALLCDESC